MIETQFEILLRAATFNKNDDDFLLNQCKNCDKYPNKLYLNLPTSQPSFHM